MVGNEADVRAHPQQQVHQGEAVDPPMRVIGDHDTGASGRDTREVGGIEFSAHTEFAQRQAHKFRGVAGRWQAAVAPAQLGQTQQSVDNPGQWTTEKTETAGQIAGNRELGSVGVW